MRLRLKDEGTEVTEVTDLTDLTDLGRKKGPPRQYRVKHSGRWPNCENIACFEQRSAVQLRQACDENPTCTGFTFEQHAVLSGGCLKACGDREFGGFSEGDYEYFMAFDEEGERIELGSAPGRGHRGQHAAFGTGALSAPAGEVEFGSASRRLSSSAYRRKHVGKWPHCSNIQCLAGRTLAEMQSLCDGFERCTGFTFTHEVTFGDGCLKACSGREYEGYDEGDSDFHVRILLARTED